MGNKQLDLIEPPFSAAQKEHTDNIPGCRMNYVERKMLIALSIS